MEQPTAEQPLPNQPPSTIDVPFPDADALRLKIGVGACRLSIRPGDGPAWVAGTYTDSTGSLPCRITQEGGSVSLTQNTDMADIRRLFHEVPAFDLSLGSARPYQLTIETGASDSHLDLGGLPIGDLTLHIGAGKVVIDFSAPNTQGMGRIMLTAGAASIEVLNIANSGAAELRAEGGAAGFTFDFGGALQRDMSASITTGMSGVSVRVPGTTAARITPSSVLGGVSVGDGFVSRDGAFWTPAAVAEAAPALSVHASVTFGGLTLELS